MVTENFGNQGKLPQELIDFDHDLVEAINILTVALKTHDAFEIKMAIANVVALLGKRQILFAKAGHKDLLTGDKERISALNKIYGSLDEELPVDQSVVDLIESIFS